MTSKIKHFIHANIIVHSSGSYFILVVVTDHYGHIPACLLTISSSYRPVYLCGEVERGGGEESVAVALVCKENWEEFVRYLPDGNFPVPLEVKKLNMINSNLSCELALWWCHYNMLLILLIS